VIPESVVVTILPLPNDVTTEQTRKSGNTNPNKKNSLRKKSRLRHKNCLDLNPELNKRKLAAVSILAFRKWQRQIIFRQRLMPFISRPLSLG